MIVVATVDQTCGACPAQWEGVTDDGRPVYARYRGGWLSVQVGPVGGDIDAALEATAVVGARLSEDRYQGHLTYEELKTATAEVMSWP